MTRVIIINLANFKGYSPLGSPGTTWLKSEVLKNPVLVSAAQKLGKTPAQVALRWGLQTGHSILPKSTNESRIKENFDVFNWSIPDDLLAKFSEIQQASFAHFFFVKRKLVKAFPIFKLQIKKLCFVIAGKIA